MKKETKKSKGTGRKIFINMISFFLFVFSVSTIAIVGYSLVDKYLENRELNQIRESKKDEMALEDILGEEDYDNFETDTAGNMTNLVEFPSR